MRDPLTSSCKGAVRTRPQLRLLPPPGPELPLPHPPPSTPGEAVITFLPSKPWGGSEQQVRFLLPGATLSLPLWGNLVAPPQTPPRTKLLVQSREDSNTGVPGFTRALQEEIAPLTRPKLGMAMLPAKEGCCENLGTNLCKAHRK